MKPLIEMFTFGRFTIRFQEQEIAPPPRHGEALCKALLCQPGRQAEFFWLADELWPEAEGDQAMQYLYVASNAVRSTLPRGILLTHRQMQSYQLVGQEHLWIDADAALDLLAQAQALGPTTEQALPLLEQAMGYFQRGRFLAGIEESWAHARRSTLVTARERALCWLVRAYTQQNRLSEAERLLATELAQTPHNENLLRSLMQVLHQEGLTYRAIDTYEEFARALRKVKKQPAQETTELYRQLERAPRFQELPPLVQATPPATQQEANGQLPAPGVEAESTRVPVDRAMVYQSAPAFLAPDRFPAIAWPSLHLHQGLALMNGTAAAWADPQAVGAWLASEAGRLGQMIDAGWSPESILATVQMVLNTVQALPASVRQHLLTLGASASLSGLPLPVGSHVTEEERVQLNSALGQRIGEGWMLFHTVGNAQVLAVGQALLSLVQQCHALLPSSTRLCFYTGCYNLIGIALHFQERSLQAQQAYHSAYLAALGSGELVCVIQSLTAQANSYQALGQHATAIQTIEEALRLIGQPIEETLVRAKAHLLGCWAESALSMEAYEMAHQKLDAIAEVLDALKPNEEFDRASWDALMGKYAYCTGDYVTAAQNYELALQALPAEWVMRRMLVLSPLIFTYTIMQDRAAGLATVRKVSQQVAYAQHTPLMKKPLVQALQGLLIVFPHEAELQTSVADLLQQIEP